MVKKVIKNWQFENSILENEGEPQMTLIEYVFNELHYKLVCKIKGHVLVMDEVVDMENGPSPNVYCARCYKEFK